MRFLTQQWELPLMCSKTLQNLKKEKNKRLLRNMTKKATLSHNWSLDQAKWCRSFWLFPKLLENLKFISSKYPDLVPTWQFALSIKLVYLKKHLMLVWRISYKWWSFNDSKMKSNYYLKQLKLKRKWMLMQMEKLSNLNKKTGKRSNQRDFWPAKYNLYVVLILWVKIENSQNKKSILQLEQYRNIEIVGNSQSGRTLRVTLKKKLVWLTLKNNIKKSMKL